MPEQLARFEVPRVCVDLLSDKLTGVQKQTVLTYLSLDDEISQIGSQRFGVTTKDSIPLQPVREWVTDKWEGQFICDLSRHNIPITFRTSLALAVFNARVAQHLEKVGMVEIYGSRTVQDIFKQEGVAAPIGLDRVDYPKLPYQLRAKLVDPLIGQLHQAELVARAGLVFPDGVDIQALEMVDPGFIFAAAVNKTNDNSVQFNGIHNLDYQAQAAGIALGDHLRVKGLEGAIKQTRETKEVEIDAPVTWKPIEKPEPRDIHYDPGTSFLKVFPYKEGETPDDVIKAFARLTGGTFYQGEVEEPHRGEYLHIHIAPDGRLVGLYGYNGNFIVEARQEEVDMLSHRFGDKYTDCSRRETILNLVKDIGEEIDTNQRAIAAAQTKYGQTSFIVEKGFLEALTSRRYEPATKTQFEEDKRLSKEAKRTAGIFEDKLTDEESRNLVVISDEPVNDKAVDLDYRILMAIKGSRRLGDSEAFSLIAGAPFQVRDMIGDWFGSCRSLFSRFNSILVNTAELFTVLGIAPTNDGVQLRRAYRVIAKETHPDWTSILPPEQQLMAAQKFLEATEAYKNLQSRIGQVDLDTLSSTYYLGRISELFKAETM